MFEDIRLNSLVAGCFRMDTESETGSIFTELLVVSAEKAGRENVL